MTVFATAGMNDDSLKTMKNDEFMIQKKVAGALWQVKSLKKCWKSAEKMLIFYRRNGDTLLKQPSCVFCVLFVCVCFLSFCTAEARHGDLQGSDLCLKNDEFCIGNDEFCIKWTLTCKKGALSPAAWRSTCEKVCPWEDLSVRRSIREKIYSTYRSLIGGARKTATTFSISILQRGDGSE